MVEQKVANSIKTAASELKVQGQAASVIKPSA